MFKNPLAALVAGLLFVVAVQSVAIAQQPGEVSELPLSSSNASSYVSAPLTFAQQTARFEAEQRMLRMEWNKWIAHSPLRPHMNSSYMSNGAPRFYLPSRGVIVSAGYARTWYW